MCKCTYNPIIYVFCDDDDHQQHTRTDAGFPFVCGVCCVKGANTLGGSIIVVADVVVVAGCFSLVVSSGF